MKKVIIAVFMICSFFVSSNIWADTWAVVANIYGGETETPGVPPVPHPGTIHTINLETAPPTVYGPFLQDQLLLGPFPPEGTSGGGILDVAYIPGCRYALVSNFGDSLIHRIDLSNPSNPILSGSLRLGIFQDAGVDPDDPTDDNYDPIMFAEDIAVTNDGHLALVSDGAFSSFLAFINLQTFTLNGLFDLNEYDNSDPPVIVKSRDAQAVAIAPEGRTVLLADYFSGEIHYGLINNTQDGLESINSLVLCNQDLVDDDADPSTPPVCMDYQGWPVNIAISPDGRTAIVAESWCGAVWVLEITGPGTVVAGNPFFLQGLPGGFVDDPVGEPDACHRLGPAEEQLYAGGQQSIEFSPDGVRAYVVSNIPDDYDDTEDPPALVSFNPDQLSWLQITGPGTAAIGAAGAADLLSNTSGGFFGVDVLSLTPNGDFALVGNPSDGGEEDESLGIPGCSRNVSYVNLQSFSVGPLATDSEYPIGIDICYAAPIGPVPGFTTWGTMAFIFLAGICALFRLKKPRPV